MPGEQDEELDEQRALSFLLDELKRIERTFNIHHFVSLISEQQQREGKHPDIDLNAVLEHYQNLYLDGWFIPDFSQNWTGGWVKLSSYGHAQLELEYKPVFLDPINTVKELKEAVPNIDTIAVKYYAESLMSIKKRLFLAAAVTMGCASERSILVLIEAVQEHHDDDELNEQFKNKRSIKSKFELLLETIKQRNLKNELTEQYSGTPETVEKIKALFVDVDTHLEQMFSIYRINRNDAGHPTGRDFSLDVVKAQAAMFRRYCEVIYRLIEFL